MTFELGHKTNNHLPENTALGPIPSNGVKSGSDQDFFFF